MKQRKCSWRSLRRDQCKIRTMKWQCIVLSKFEISNSNTSKFSLGKYVEGNEESSHLGTEPKYYSQMYTDGTVCDLSGSKRVTEVRFTCGNEKQMSAITDIKVICFSFCTYFKQEPYSCNYVITIATPFLCSHADFKPKAEVVKNIVCATVGANDENLPEEKEHLDQQFLK